MGYKDDRTTLRNATARLSFPRNSMRPSGNQQYVEITVRDEDANLEIIEIEIEPEDLIRLMGGGQADAVVRLLAPKFMPRLGKEMITGPVVKIEGIKGYGKDPEAPQVVAAIEQARAEGWESVDYRFSHGVHSLHVWKWVEKQ